MTIIYHNPRCSKSRATLALLEERGITPHIVEYLKTPLGIAEIRRILKMLCMDPHDIVRKVEAKQAGVDPVGLDDAALVAAIAAHPEIMERPIVLHGNRAAIGRPPENILKILK